MAQAAANLGCPPASSVLKGVYHPERLIVTDPCHRVTGRVALIREHEEDGDLHFDIVVTDKGLLRSGNYSQQEGLLVVEFMPRDVGHLLSPSVGDRVSLVGALVDDSEHNWSEIHPVWAVSINGGSWHRSGPQFGGDPAYARSDDALGLCRTTGGSPCTGYGTSAPASQPAAPPSPPPSNGNCTPGYSPCIAPGSDVDCAGGSGDGPRYVQGPVRVSGSDPYGLDSDGNGVGCD